MNNDVQYCNSLNNVANNGNYNNNRWEIKTSGKRQSPWFSDASEKMKFERLGQNISVDVVIVGGGIAGISTAYLLSKAGKKIAVIEDGNIGSGETGRTTAHITNALDDRYYDLERMYGEEGARIAAESHSRAIDFVESTVNKENIDCDFERLDGFLFLDPSDKQKSLEDELQATHRVGIAGTELLQRTPIESFDTGPCIRFPGQGQFHPLKYLDGLSQAIMKNNGRIFTETHAQEIDSGSVVTSDGCKVEAKNIVVATNAPVRVDQVSKIYDKQEPYRTYVIGAKIKKGSVKKALYWDTGDHNSKNSVPPYHYVRIQNGGRHDNDDESDLLIIGGEDHKTGEISEEGTELKDRFNKLIAWAKERFPIQDIIYRWSGQVMEPKGSLAFIGPNPGDAKNVYIATGDSGNGMTHGTIAGIMLSDLILGKDNPWASLYNPSRKNNDSTGSEKESSPSSPASNQETKKKDEAGQKQQIDLSKSQGKVIERTKDDKNDSIALYKDEAGKMHTYSAVCTHLGCTVKWNPLEGSFDCPCHGSRFAGRTGSVINGPANSNLEPKE